MSRSRMKPEEVTLRAVGAPARKVEPHIDAYVELLPLPAIVFSSKGLVLAANAAALRLLRTTSQSLTYSNVFYDRWLSDELRDELHFNADAPWRSWKRGALYMPEAPHEIEATIRSLRGSEGVRLLMLRDASLRAAIDPIIPGINVAMAFGDVVTQLAPDNMIVRQSHAIEALLGHCAADLLGCYADEVFDAASLVTLRHEVATGAFAGPRQVRVAGLAGSTRHLSVIGLEGADGSLILVARDVTTTAEVEGRAAQCVAMAFARRRKLANAVFTRARAAPHRVNDALHDLAECVDADRACYWSLESEDGEEWLARIGMFPRLVSAVGEPSTDSRVPFDARVRAYLDRIGMSQDSRSRGAPPFLPDDPWIKHSIEVPVPAEGPIEGILCLQYCRELPSLPDDALELAHYAGQLIAGILRDGRQQRLERQIAQSRHYDDLTGLPNRKLALTTLEGLRSGANTRFLSALLLDVESYSFLTTTLGSPGSDALISGTARRIRTAVGLESATVRYRDNAFLIFHAHDTHDGGEVLARSLLKLFDDPIGTAQESLHATATIGVAVAERAELDPDDTIRQAEIALRSAKEQGPGGYRTYGHDLGISVQRRMALEHHLKTACANQELSVVYQPQVSCATRAIVGAEALLRWHSSVLGPVLPSSFIPVAESSSFIHTIGMFVFETVCRDLAEQIAQARVVRPVAVNVSPRQLLAPDFADRILATARNYGIAPNLVELEITESALVDVRGASSRSLMRLVEAGFQLVVDDFGVGYSNLSFLKNQPISKLKLDGSLLVGVPGNDRDNAVVRMALDFARTLDIESVAEQVEHEEQLAFLTSAGCSAAQGYLTSVPLGAREYWATFNKDIAGAAVAPS